MSKTLGDFAKLLGIPIEDIPIVDLLNSFGEKIEAKDAEIERLQAEFDELAHKFLAKESVAELREEIGV